MKTKTKNKVRNIVTGYLFISPVLLGILIFTYYPAISSFFYSFQSFDGFFKQEWIGIRNYVNLFTRDMETWTVLKNTFIYSIITVPLGLVLGYIVAILANMKVKGSYFFRVLFFLPCMIPSVSSGVLWRDILDPDFGLMTQIFRSLGMNPTFFTSASTAMATLIWTGTWGVGGGMVLWLADFKNIPSTLYESAQVDGANALQRVFYITIPMSTSMIFYNLVTGVIGSLQVSTTLIMAGSTGGKGPDNSLYFVAVKIYTDAFKRGGLMGYACAFGWVLFTIIGILTFINFKTSKWVQYGEENG